MAQKIYLIQVDGQLAPMVEQPYDEEAILQELLERYPDLLAGDQMSEGEPRRWLLLDRESAVPDDVNASGRWALDHLFVDQDGVLTLVEVKRSTDTRIRREVVGQMLDYAANAVAFWSIERIRATYERRSTQDDTDPNEAVANLLELGASDASAVDAFWHKVDVNLRAGQLRLVFVADQIPTELRQVVEFLDGQMKADVLAVEVRQFVGQGLKTLVPRLVGRTAAAAHKAAVRAARETPWSVEEFLARVDSGPNPADASVMRRIIEWGSENGVRFAGGTGAKDAYLSLEVRDSRTGKASRPFQLSIGTGRPRLSFQLTHFGPMLSTESGRAIVRERLLRATGVEFDTTKAYPAVPWEVLEDPEKLSALLETMGWVIATIRHGQVT